MDRATGSGRVGRRRWLRRGGLSGGVLLAGALLLAGCGEQLTEAEHVERADAYLAEGAQREAIIHYRSALQEGPGNVEARAGLGLAYLADNDLVSAVSHLRRALEGGADPARVGPPLARALVELGRGREIADLPLKADDAGLEPAERARLTAYLALGSIQGGDNEAGASYLERAQAHGGAELEVRTAEAFLAFARGEVAAAERAVAAALEVDGDYTPALWVGAETAWARGDLRVAEERFSRYVELRPGMVPQRFARGVVRLERGDEAGARADAEFLREGAPASPAGHLLTGRALWRDGERDAAEGYLEQALARDAEFRAARPYLAAIHLERGNLAQAEHHLDRFHAAGPGTSRSHRLVALLRQEQGRPDAALEHLREVTAQRPELFMGLGDQLALLQLQTGRHGEAVRSVQRMLQGGAAALAAPEVPPVSAVIPDAEAARLERLLRLLGLSREDRLDQAYAELAERFSGRERLEAAMFLAMAESARGADRTVRAWLEHALALDPDQVAVSHALAQLALDEGSPGEARERYRAVLERDPEHAPTWLRLGAMELEQGQPQAAVEALAEAVALRPDAVGPRTQQARAHLAAGEAEAALEVLEPVAAAGADDAPFLETKGRAHRMLAEHEAAVEAYTRLVRLAPEQAEVHHDLGSAYQAAGDWQSAASAYGRAAELAPEDDALRFRYVESLIRLGDLESAESALERLRERQVANASLTALQGRLARERGAHDRAVALFEQAVAEERSTRYVLELADTRLQAGDPAGARETLERWLEDHPQDTLALATLGELLMEREDWPAAEAWYRHGLEQHEAHLLFSNNLAWALIQQDRAGEAEPYARTAVERSAEGNVEALQSLSHVLLVQGRPEEAERRLRRALELSPGRPELRLGLGRALSAQGEGEEARTVLAELVGELEQDEDAGELLGEAREAYQAAR